MVQVEAEYEGLANYLLGRTLVVDHIDHGIAIAKKYQYTIRMVTIEGESLNPGGSLTGGAFKNNSNLLGRRREIDELHENVEKLKLNIEKLQSLKPLINGKLEANLKNNEKILINRHYVPEFKKKFGI